MIEDEIRLDRSVRAVWRAKWLILTGTILAAAITAFIGFREAPIHTANVLIRVGRVWKEPLEDPYVTSETANSAGFITELASAQGLRPGVLKRSIRAEPVTAGPPRSAYPILVRITASTESSDESIKLAGQVAEALVARHKKKYDDAIAPHLELQQRLETRYGELRDGKAAGASPDVLLKLDRELDEVKASNTSPTQTEMTHTVSPVAAGPILRPPYLRNAAVAALLAAAGLIAIVAVAGQLATATKDAGERTLPDAQNT